jgi:ornithine carbamoyltransferase
MMRILGREDVQSILAERDVEVADLVRQAYQLHEAGRTSVPHSTLLRLNGSSGNRIIALPAFIDGPDPVTGIKWIASFPGNIAHGLERASATIVLNSMQDGRPAALIEGSVISAKRTAASAALAAEVLTRQRRPDSMLLIGCGVINFEVLRFVRLLVPEVERVVLYDRDPARAVAFAERIRTSWPLLDAKPTSDLGAALAGHELISLATTAVEPHLGLEDMPETATVLHLSLRDLEAAAVLSAQNVVDDVDHAVREQTSLHLAEKLVGHRAFVHATIGQLLSGRTDFERDADRRVVFSPFGLGVLDIALASYVLAEGSRHSMGTTVSGFCGAEPTARQPAAKVAADRPARHLISMQDLSDDEIATIVHRGVEFAGGARSPAALDGQVIGTYFRKTSTRTRTAFSSAALRLGGRIIAYGPDDLQTNTGETSEDTGRVFSGMLDALVARTAQAEAELRSWAGQSRMSVVNAMSAEEHPTQSLADLTTMLRIFGRLEGLRVLYLGEGNNTAAALARALSRFPGVRLDLRTPPGYGLTDAVSADAASNCRRSGAEVVERHDMADLPGGFDVIYTTRWQTTGTSKADPNWRQVFAAFQVHRGLWDANPTARFLHDLPAHRGDEVTAEVLDGPHSVAFEQAENKLYSAMAVLEWCRTR